MLSAPECLLKVWLWSLPKWRITKIVKNVWHLCINLKLIIRFGLKLTHWVGKSFSKPFFVELMRFFENACIGNFLKHFEIGKWAFKTCISSRLCMLTYWPSSYCSFSHHHCWRSMVPIFKIIPNLRQPVAIACKP